MEVEALFTGSVSTQLSFTTRCRSRRAAKRMTTGPPLAIPGEGCRRVMQAEEVSRKTRNPSDGPRIEFSGRDGDSALQGSSFG